MKDALSRRNHSPNYWSSYTDVHSRLGLQRGEGVKREAGPKVQYNLLTGMSFLYSLSLTAAKQTMNMHSLICKLNISNVNVSHKFLDFSKIKSW